MFSFSFIFASFLHISAQAIDESGGGIDLHHFGAAIFGKPIENDKLLAVDENTNAEELGPYLEGDLLIPSSSRNGMKAESLRWKNGEVPFEIRGNFNAFNMDMIERALNEYHSKTCVKFVPRRPSDRDYISIESGASGCWSSVGRIGGKQVVNLQTPGCVSKIGTVIHELLHVLGFLHEQNREERDGFVIIRKNNIKTGYEINFTKARAGETTGFGIAYDYGSVMHYSPTAFSKNGQPTIEAKTKISERMGQRDGFSKKDVEKVNKMYKCKQNQNSGSTTSKPTTEPTSKPPSSESSGLGGLINILFPGSMDEEEMFEQ